MDNIFASIVITVLIGFGFELFKPEITKLRVIMREKQFETFVVVGIGILISISLYGTLL
jgi:hypothetical protein